MQYRSTRGDCLHAARGPERPRFNDDSVTKSKLHWSSRSFPALQDAYLILVRVQKLFKYCTLFLESDFGANAEIVFMLREDPKDRALTTIPLKSQLYWTSRSFPAQPNTCVVLVRVNMELYLTQASFHAISEHARSLSSYCKRNRKTELEQRFWQNRNFIGNLDRSPALPDTCLVLVKARMEFHFSQASLDVVSEHALRLSSCCTRARKTEI